MPIQTSADGRQPGRLKILILTLKNCFFERVIFVPDFRLACPGGITTGSYHEKRSRDARTLRPKLPLAIWDEGRERVFSMAM